MRIVISTQVFPPERHPTAVMVRQLADYLVLQGHDVVVVAGLPHHPTGVVEPGFAKLWHTSQHDRVELIRVGHLTTTSRSAALRSLALASQSLGLAIGMLSVRRPDVLVNFGPPLAGPLLTGLIARVKRAGAVSVIFDLYPEAAVVTGHLRPGLVSRLLLRSRHLGQRLSDRVVVLSEGFAAKAREGDQRNGVLDVIPVWLADDEVVPGDRETCWRKEQDIDPAEFLCLYAGTIGEVSGADVIVDAAALLSHEPAVQLVLVGEGTAKERLERKAEEMELRNIRFLPFQPRERLGEMQSSADLSLVTLAPGAGVSSVPSKVVGYLAAGRTVVAAVDAESDTGSCVRAGGGVVVPPSDPEALASAVLSLFTDPERRAAAQRTARTYFERTFAASAVLPQYGRVIAEAGNRSPRVRRERRWSARRAGLRPAR